jgi:hypothetical protein
MTLRVPHAWRDVLSALPLVTLGGGVSRPNQGDLRVVRSTICRLTVRTVSIAKSFIRAKCMSCRALSGEPRSELPGSRAKGRAFLADTHHRRRLNLFSEEIYDQRTLRRNLRHPSWGRGW